MGKKSTIHYCDGNSLLVVNPLGKIRKLYTPFRAECVEATEGLKKGTKVYVEEVQSTQRDELLFVIQGRPYLFKYFQISIRF